MSPVSSTDAVPSNDPPPDDAAPGNAATARRRPDGLRRDLLTAHLPAAAWLVAMTVALAVPSNTADLPPWWPRILHFQALDKVIHFLLFAVAAALVARSFRRLPALARPLLLAFLATAAYGGVTEVGQHVLTDRQGEWADVGADVVGAAVGVAAMAAAGAGRGGRGAGGDA